MIITKALQEFKEKYNRESIESIVNLSNDKTMYMSSFNAFNLTESVNRFKLFIDGYAEYRTEKVNDKKKPSNDTLLEHTKLLIDNKLKDHEIFEELKLPFRNASSFVQEYVECINILSDTVNKNQSLILESTDDVSSSGCVLEFTEMFLDKLNDRFYPIMEHLLNSSGYYSRKQLRTPSVKKEQEYHFFL